MRQSLDLWKVWRIVYQEERQMSDSYIRVAYAVTRDQFALAALTGILANPNASVTAMSFKDGGAAVFAERAYRVADAMLVARDKKEAG
jgi:hypothetical protein